VKNAINCKMGKMTRMRGLFARKRAPKQGDDLLVRAIPLTELEAAPLRVGSFTVFFSFIRIEAVLLATGSLETARRHPVQVTVREGDRTREAQVRSVWTGRRVENSCRNADRSCSLPG